MFADRVKNINWHNMPYREENEWLLQCYMDIGLRDMNEIRRDAQKYRQRIREKHEKAMHAWHNGQLTVQPRDWSSVIKAGIDGQVYLKDNGSKEMFDKVLVLYMPQPKPSQPQTSYIALTTTPQPHRLAA